jgi:protein-S-isoprenylcysteine O-methyltransferase Ste14
MRSEQLSGSMSSELLKWFSKFADAYSTWTLVALGAFMCNLALWLPVAGWVLPYTIDLPPEQMKAEATAAALLRNLTVIALFTLQHSLMPRPWFKEAVKKQLPPGYVAPLYSLLSGVFLHLLLWQWAPMGPYLWRTEPFSLLFLSIYALRAIAFVCCLAAVQALPIEEVQLNEAKAGNVEGPRKKELMVTFPFNAVRHPAMVGGEKIP